MADLVVVVVVAVNDDGFQHKQHRAERNMTSALT